MRPRRIVTRLLDTSGTTRRKLRPRPRGARVSLIGDPNIPVEFVGSSGAQLAIDVQGFSWAFDVQGIDRCLIVAVQWIESITTPSGIFLESVTFNGSPLTPIVQTFDVATHSEIWLATGVDVGTYAVLLTWGGDGIGEGGAAKLVAGSVCFARVHQTSPIRGALDVAVATSRFPANVLDVYSPLGLVFQHVAVNLSAGTLSLAATGGQAVLWNARNGVGSQNRRGAGAWADTLGESDPSPLSRNYSWAMIAARPWIAQAFELRTA